MDPVFDISDLICEGIVDVILQNTQAQIREKHFRTRQIAKTAVDVCDTLFDFVDLYVAVCDDSKVGSPFGPGTPPVPSAIDCHARNRVSIEKPRVHKRPSIPTITSTRSTSGSSRTRRKKTNTSQSEVPQLLDGSSFENEMMEADTTTLSHIFSVSTPRQLAPKEQARRRDILKYLEKCQEKKRQHENDKKNFQQRKEEMKKRFHELHGAEYTFDHHGEIIRIQSVPISNTNGINRTIIGCKVGSLEEPEAEEATRLNRKRNRKITDKLEPPISNGFIPTPVVHMESANLVQGVRSIHLGVSKEGPKRVPSRRSRVLRHNYKLKPESREKMPKIQPCKPVEARTTLSLPALKVRVNDNSKQVTQAMDRMEKRNKKQCAWDRHVRPPRVRSHGPHRKLISGRLPDITNSKSQIKRGFQVDYFTRTLRR